MNLPLDWKTVGAAQLYYPTFFAFDVFTDKPAAGLAVVSIVWAVIAALPVLREFRAAHAQMPWSRQ